MHSICMQLLFAGAVCATPLSPPPAGLALSSLCQQRGCERQVHAAIQRTARSERPQGVDCKAEQGFADTRCFECHMEPQQVRPLLPRHGQRVCRVLLVPHRACRQVPRSKHTQPTTGAAAVGRVKIRGLHQHCAGPVLVVSAVVIGGQRHVPRQELRTVPSEATREVIL
ncbi:hypothetical protein COO60DRAFT_1530176 [Scenedesmus sp. NREL 46B-D3]|nr:hypothetical protein COO60DRAFT_1530176 [Scenedesmus sp. NREL 46B-D3]